MNSCKTIPYEKSQASIYHEFGSKAHYYSNRSDSFGIELFHGFNYYDAKHKIGKHILPDVVTRRLSDNKDWRTMFILQNYLSPSIVVLQKHSSYLSTADGSLIPKRENRMRHPEIDTAENAISYLLTTSTGDTIFCQEKSMNKQGSTYRISSFAFDGNWLKSHLDTPSSALCRSDIDYILDSWVESDFVSEACDSKENLLQTASANFWKSKNNYLFPLDIIKSHEDSTVRAADYYEASTTFQSFAGNYRKTLLQRDSLTPKPPDVAIPRNLTFTDAKRIIYDSARAHSIVIINEAHTQPRNRRFFSELLDSLYEIGYHDLFVETLSYEDTAINTRKFPIQESGYYSSEPNFGNALRKALKAGFTLHSYDNDFWDTQRETAQAQVISDFLQKNAGAKILVYCGHGHLDESPADSMMGYYLKAMTGVDPFTIEQTKLVEKGAGAFESNLYESMLGGSSFSDPQTILQNQKLWVPGNYASAFDMMVALPPSRFDANEIPDWQFVYGNKPYEIDLNGSQYANCLLQIFDSKELKEYAYWNAIPISNLQLRSENRLLYYFQPGQYSIYVTDVHRNILYQKEISL